MSDADLSDVYATYRLQLLRDGETLRALWEQHDAGEPEAEGRLRRFLHRIAGTAGSYGFGEVSARAAALRARLEETGAPPPSLPDRDALADAIFEAALGPARLSSTGT